VAKVKSYRIGGANHTEGLEPLVLFSGDCFNPSIMSTVTKGKQMVPCLNSIGIDGEPLGDTLIGTSDTLLTPF